MRLLKLAPPYRVHLLDYGQRFEQYIIPGSLGPLQSPDEREPDALKWLANYDIATSPEYARHPFSSHIYIRDEFIHRYGFSIPSKEAIIAIHGFAPQGIIDFGCGNGYWSFVLQQNGLTAIPIDLMPPKTGRNHYWKSKHFGATPLPPKFKRHWTKIQTGDTSSIQFYGKPEMALFISWPPMSDMAYRALKAYSGNKFIYIGEGETGCTADDDFFELLSNEWRQVDTLASIPSFNCIHDCLEFYVRI